MPLFAATFPRPGLVTNQYAHWNPDRKDTVKSADWEMTSGSLFSTADGYGYTGPVDKKSPNAQSTAGTNSAVFRLSTRRLDFGDVRVDTELNLTRQTASGGAWDGVHIWLRYQSQYHLYYASVCRRDGHVVVKKKIPGGPNPSNGGTYYVVGKEVTGQPVPLGQWKQVGASVRNNPDGSVTIDVFRDGKLVLTAVDKGIGHGPPITKPGAVGIRGDNTEFQFRNFVVSDLAAPAPSIPTKPAGDTARYAQAGYTAYAEKLTCPCCAGPLPTWAKLPDSQRAAWVAAATAVRAES